VGGPATFSDSATMRRTRCVDEQSNDSEDWKAMNYIIATEIFDPPQ